MKRIGIALGGVVGLFVAYAVFHMILIEVGREVVVLHATAAGGAPVERRLWVVDHKGTPWLHGNRGSGWVDAMLANLDVDVERAGATAGYRADVVRGPHPDIDRLLREKYGIADRWVRTIAPDNEATVAIRLVPR